MNNEIKKLSKNAKRRREKKTNKDRRLKNLSNYIKQARKKKNFYKVEILEKEVAEII